MIIVARRKEKEADKQKKVLEDLFMQENALHQELLNTSFLTFTGRTQGVIAREKRDIARDIRVEEREYQKIYTDFLVLIEEVNTQADKIDVIKANIKDNQKEKAIIEKTNKDTVKEYGEKFNLLNWQQQQVGQQPNESDEAYIKRLKDLENLKADPTLYKQKAIKENVNKLKTNLKQIVKDTGKIDELVAHFRDDDEAYILNSYWDQISVYLKKFGFDVNNTDFNFLKLKEELKRAIENIKNQPFNVTIKSEKLMEVLQVL